MRATRSEVEACVTLVVKTFERPHVLERLVGSVRAQYPSMPLYVVDDSRTPLDPVPDGITVYWHLPFDSGLAHGRNFGLRHVETEYVVFSDDDLVFTERTDLRKMLGALRDTAFDVVGCAYLDHQPGKPPFVNWYEGTIDIVDGVQTHVRGACRGYLDGFPVYDVLHNFFMARREALGDDPWDAELKSGGAEHIDFFLTIKDRGLRCTRLPSVVVEHRPELSPGYTQFRDREDFRARYRAKRGIREERASMARVGRRELARHRLLRARSRVGARLRRLHRL